jgi:hypothetical protein
MVQTGRDWNGRFWICYSGYTSLFKADSAAVLKWAKYPKGTPTRDALEKWLKEIDAADAARLAAKAAGKLAEEPAGVVDEAGGFGPEVFAAEELGPEDPNFQTRTIV